MNAAGGEDQKGSRFPVGRQGVDDESANEHLEKATNELRQSARAALGVTGEDKAPPIAEVVAQSGTGWYPLSALGLLAIVNGFQGTAFLVLAPDISRALGIGRAGVATLLALSGFVLALAALPVAGLVQRRARRAVVAIVTGFGWSLMTLFTGLVTNIWQMFAVLVGDGVTSGSVYAVHQPLLMDSYPPQARVRVLGFYRAVTQSGEILAPLFVGLLNLAGFTWRGVFLIMGLTSVAAAFYSLRLRDPGFGRWDVSKVREMVAEGSSPQGRALTDEKEIGLSFFEIARGLMLIPTIRRLYAALAALGMFVIPLLTFMSFFLDERWGLTAGGRSVFFAAMPVFSIGALYLFGRKGEGAYRADPARLLKLGAGLLTVSMAALLASVISPWFGLMVLSFGLFNGPVAVIQTAVNTVFLSVIPARMRPHASALGGIFFAGVGGVAGATLLAGTDERYGIVAAMAAVAVPGLGAAGLLRSAAGTVNDDLNRMIDQIVEEEEVVHMRARGESLPMLSCRDINFSYEQLQVLFGVDFTVEDGEMVALLGTNGSGKSTLLRVIAGLGLPQRGVVRLDGIDITYVDPQRRLGLGMVMVSGGRSTFGPLSVLDNLRIFASLHGRNKSGTQKAIEETFEMFPQLAERRDQSAATLSGGERQMLGLARAFIVRPRLLLIDELSLGLAPKVVSELLQMVKRINQQGAAVVIVEQSVNTALDIAEHAYFMEKGQILFNGPSADLMDRPDLLRAVFLAGAAR